VKEVEELGIVEVQPGEVGSGDPLGVALGGNEGLEEWAAGLDDLSDVSGFVASDGSLHLKGGDVGGEHLDSTEVGGRSSEKRCVVLLGDVLHYSHGLGDLGRAILKIWKVGVLEAHSLLHVSP